MEEFFNQGWDAYDRGEAFSSNPYLEGSNEAYQWDQGWIGAEDWDQVR